MAHLLTDLNESVQYIVEADQGSDVKKHYLQGIFLQAAIPNRNHRIYPTSVLANESARYVKENVKNGRAYGELGHPAGPNINADRICIHIKSLKQEGDNFLGKALIASTPMGKIVRDLLSDGASLGVSSRALGSLKPLKEGLSEVQDDLKLLAIDVVTDPSAPQAYVNAVLENKEWVFDAVKNLWTEQVIEQTKKKIKNYTQKQLDEAQLYLFDKFLSSITNS